MTATPSSRWSGFRCGLAVLLELDEHAAYITEHWQQGCTNAAWLTVELRERGYQGSERNVAGADNPIGAGQAA